MDYKLDPVTGDLAIEKNDLVMITGLPAVKQAATVRLRTFRGEHFLDPNLGLLTFDGFFGRGVVLGVVKSKVRATLAATPGVVSVSKVDAIRLGTTLTIKAQGKSTDGPLDLTVPVVSP